MHSERAPSTYSDVRFPVTEPGRKEGLVLISLTNLFCLIDNSRSPGLENVHMVLPGWVFLFHPAHTVLPLVWVSFLLALSSPLISVRSALGGLPHPPGQPVVNVTSCWCSSPVSALLMLAVSVKWVDPVHLFVPMYEHMQARGSYLKVVKKSDVATS